MGSRVRADGSGDSQRDGGLAGAEEISCTEEIAGAMAIASVGV